MMFLLSVKNKKPTLFKVYQKNVKKNRDI